jgi:GT2 family glycosyltransferase
MGMTAGLLAGSHPTAEAYDADILILSLDRIAETEAAIRSASLQGGGRFHIIVFDQGSDHATLARLKTLVNAQATALLASAGRNLGVAEGRNRAAALGHGRAILALDNDAEFGDETTVARAVALLDEEPRLAAIGFRIMNGDGSAEDTASWGYPEARRTLAASRFPCATFVGAGHAIRRQAWEQIGGYDAALFFTWEEYDFALRAIDQGWQLVHAGDIAVHHKLAAERRVAWTGRRWFYFVRNRLYIARKWNPTWPELIVRVAGYGVRSAWLGLPRQGVAAIGAAFRMTLPQKARAMAPSGLAYLHLTDTGIRGGTFARIQGEVFARLPSATRR